MNFGFIIDNRKCIGCHACTVACKSEHEVPIGVNRTWVKYIEKGEFPNTRRLFSVMRCNHCEAAPCVDICPVTALFVRDDGIVDFDKHRCIGCKSCMQACPYDALYIDPDTNTAAKCNYCAHRIDVGLEPACVIVCPEHAIISGDMDNPRSEIAVLLAGEQVQVRKGEKGTRPKLFYIDGDEASLTPGAAHPALAYVQSEQAAGVGHYARYAENRLRRSAAEKPAEKLRAGLPTNGGRERPQAALPAGVPDEAAPPATPRPIVEQARRVYDAPSKGLLWGWEVSSYIWTKAIAAGVVLIPALAALTGVASPSGATWAVALAAGLFFLLATGLLLVADLDRPERFLYVLLRPQWKSWLVRGGYLIALYGASLVALGLMRWKASPSFHAVALIGTAALAASVAVYTAFLFAQAKGRDFWQSPLLPFHMLVQAGLAGCAFLSLVAAFVAESTMWQTFLHYVLLIAVPVNAMLLLAELYMPHPTADAKRAALMITRGRFRLQFYVGVLVFGHILPLVILPLMPAGGLQGAGMLVLVGIYITEHLWVRAPQYVPLS